MTEGHNPGEPFPDLPWFIDQLQQGFKRLAYARHYSDDQFQKLANALDQLEPVPDELDDLLLSLGVLPEKD